MQTDLHNASSLLRQERHLCPVDCLKDEWNEGLQLRAVLQDPCLDQVALCLVYAILYSWLVALLAINKCLEA